MVAVHLSARLADHAAQVAVQAGHVQGRSARGRQQALAKRSREGDGECIDHLEVPTISALVQVAAGQINAVQGTAAHDADHTHGAKVRF